MAWASRNGRARTSSTNPQAQAVCDRCGRWYNRVNLQFQWDWRGAALQNLWFLVCRSCLDVPQEQLRAIVLPADPVPVAFPRTEPFFTDETNVRYTTGGDTIDPITGIPVIGGDQRITQADDLRVEQQTGEPPGGLNELPGTDPAAPGDDDPGLPPGNTEVPDTGPLT